MLIYQSTSFFTSATTSSNTNAHGNVTQFKQSFSVVPGQKHEKQANFIERPRKVDGSEKEIIYYIKASKVDSNSTLL